MSSIQETSGANYMFSTDHRPLTEQEKLEKRLRKEKRKLEKQKRKQEQLKNQMISSEGSAPSVATKRPKLPKISFPINEQCTSFTLSPSGRHVIAGFQDGTLRLFDTTGRLWRQSEENEEIENLFDSNSDEDDISYSNGLAKNANRRMVASKSYQTFGAVACQIHAKGVITSLIMDVDCCESGKFAFGGVLRGSTELVAVDLRQIENFHDNYANYNDGPLNILDLVKVYRHSDAKLKGFGACIKLKNSERLEYRLFTGKGIKNMHIWSFVPPNETNPEPIWQCLYDTPTNGNTINYLKFRRDYNGLLQGVSKSDDQKLRVWDLSFEESNRSDDKDVSKRSIIKQLAKKADSEMGDSKERPKRPPYVDVISTENALCVAGPYVFSGGDSMYNKMGVMYLDVEDIQSPFNHNEFALPSSNGDEESVTDWAQQNRRAARGGTGRQQRGELKSVINVAGMNYDANHVVMELSDKSFVHYYQNGHQSSLSLLPLDVPMHLNRIISLTRVHPKNTCILSTCTYNDNTNRGLITMKYISENTNGGSIGRSVRCGFSEPIHIPLKEHLLPISLKIKDTPPERTLDTSVAKKHFVPPSSNKRSKSHISKKKERTLLTTEDLLFAPDPKSNQLDSITSPLLSRRLDKGSRIDPQNENVVKKQKDRQTYQPQTNLSEVKRKGPTVSPECARQDENETKAKSNIDESKSIGRFFRDKKNDKPKREKKSKKVQFLGSNESTGVLKNQLNPQKENSFGIIQKTKKRPLEEEDYKNAILSLEKIAQNADYIQSRRVPEILTHDQHLLNHFIVECQKQKRPKLMRDVHADSISVRKSLNRTEPFYQNNGTVFSSNNNNENLEEVQFNARKQLALHHRAAHERLRNNILLSGERLLNLAANPHIAPPADSKQQLLGIIRMELEQTIKSHTESLQNLLARQELEASSLAANQTRESGKAVPQLAVSFPFPEAFDTLSRGVMRYFGMEA